MRELYYRANRDDLTGLFNPRGAKDAVKEALSGEVVNCAMLLVDMDHLKLIVGMRGRSTGDALVAVLRSIWQRRDGDICARLGEGEPPSFPPLRYKPRPGRRAPFRLSRQEFPGSWNHRVDRDLA